MDRTDDARPPPDRHVCVAPDRLSTRLGDETVILDLGSGRYYGLQGTGDRIWQLVEAGTTVTSVVDTLVQEYEVAPERCRHDVERLMNDLAASGLVEFRDVVDR